MNSTILFIHGAGGNHKIWENQTKYFSNSIAIDLPGHYRGNGRKTIEDYVKYVKKFCGKRKLKNIIMVGHSMGGAITQKFALTYPEYLKAVVLVATGAKLRVAPIIFEEIKRYDNFMKLMKKYAFSEKTPDEVKNNAVKIMKRIRPEVLYGDFEACDKFDVTGNLNRINLPTLIICGNDDLLTPVKYSEYLKQNIQNSVLKVVDGAGHMVMLEKPEEFNRILEGFIKSLGNDVF
ncbi:MAG: alpha/beta hydrolase [Candidatus Bathyarchaeia archaeon]